MPNRGRPLLLPAVVAITVICIATAPANIPLPALFGFRLPAWLAFLTFGVSFAVVTLIEAFVISRVAKLTLQRGLMISVVANAVTTAIGGLAFYGPFLFFALLIIAWRLERALSEWGAPRLWIAIVPSAPLVIFLGWSALTFFWGFGVTWWAIFGSLVPAFVVTAIIECWIGRRKDAAPRIIRGVILGNVTSYVLIVATLWIAQMSRLQVPMLTADYYTVAISHHIENGEVQRALELTEEARELHRGQIPLRGAFLTVQESDGPLWGDRTHRFPFVEGWVARDLARHGYYEEAIAILEEGLDFGYLGPVDIQSFESRIASWEAQLTQAQPASP